MKIFKLLIPIGIIAIINIVAIITSLFYINSLSEIVTLTIYILFSLSISLYLYVIIKDMISLHILKGVVSNDNYLSTIINHITSLLFKYKNHKDLLLSNTEHTYTIKILLNYVPVTNILRDDSLLICMDNNNETTYANMLKSKISDHINTIPISYERIYLILTITLTILLIPLYIITN